MSENDRYSKDNQYYLDLGKDDLPPPDVRDGLESMSDGAAIQAVVDGAVSVGATGRQLGELTAIALLQLGFHR